VTISFSKSILPHGVSEWLWSQ